MYDNISIYLSIYLSICICLDIEWHLLTASCDFSSPNFSHIAMPWFRV